MEKNFALFLITLIAVALSIWNTYSIHVLKSDINEVQLQSAIPMTDNLDEEINSQSIDIELLLNKLNELERVVKSQQNTI